MMYLHAALTIHEAGGTIDESTVKKVVSDAGGSPDDGQVKAVVAALKDVNIADVVKEAASMPAAVAAPASGAAPEAKKEEKKEDDKKSAEQASAGLASMFNQHFVPRGALFG